MELRRTPRRLSLILQLELLVQVFAADASPYPNVAARPNDFSRQADWYQQCLHVQSVKPPAADALRPDVAAKFRHCSAMDSYYDALNAAATSKDGWAEVRDCALTQHDASILMMLYANGYGVSKNIPLATKYACRVESAIDEMAGRVGYLSDLKKNSQATSFDLCDDISSGYMQGVCAEIDQRQHAKLRQARMRGLTAGLSAAQQVLLLAAQKAADAFARRRADYETDLSGTMRHALQVAAETDEQEQFIQDAVDVEQGKTPAYLPAQRGEPDTHLNQRYQAILRGPSFDQRNMGTLEKKGIIQTQGTWLAYRDAWLQFTASVRPDAEPAWRAALTERRIRQFDEFSPR